MVCNIRLDRNQLEMSDINDLLEIVRRYIANQIIERAFVKFKNDNLKLINYLFSYMDSDYSLENINYNDLKTFSCISNDEYF